MARTDADRQIALSIDFATWTFVVIAIQNAEIRLAALCHLFAIFLITPCHTMDSHRRSLSYPEVLSLSTGPETRT